MTELKPCPFCGANKAAIHAYGALKGFVVVRCTQCDAQAGPYRTEGVAIAAWERRADDALRARVEALEAENLRLRKALKFARHELISWGEFEVPGNKTLAYIDAALAAKDGEE